MRVKILSFLLLASFLLLSGNVYARSGCCSSHSGVCGCGCCDGSSLSSTCVPYYPWCNSPTPQPTPIVIPTSLNGSTSYNYNNSTKSYDVTFDWDYWSPSSGWSIGISQYAGADPGPNMDTTTSAWTFKNVSPGRKFVNMKALVNGYWSGVSYWTIDIPPYPTSTPTPTITPIPTQTPTSIPTNIPKITKEIVQQKTTINKSLWSWFRSLFK